MRFDLTEMPKSTNDQDQDLVPTGIHWQVSQACSLQNLIFEMPEATDDEKPTHVGIFMENGSGGFVSDLVFKGGNIGWRAGKLLPRPVRSEMLADALQDPSSIPSSTSSSKTASRRSR
jgi:hypothetical protein